MSADAFTAAKPKPAAPCARCRAPAVEGWVVWGHLVCAGCASDWQRREEFTSGAVDAAAGVACSALGWTVRGQLVDMEAAHRATCAEAQRRTDAWVRKGAA